MRYAIYNPTTGQILRIFNGDEETAALQVLDGEAITPMETGDDTSHYIVDGVAFEVPVRPDDTNYCFDFNIREWVDPRSLSQLKDAAWEQIKRERADATAQPLQTPYGVFDAHEEGVNNISRSVLLANNMVALGIPVAINFTLADNTTVMLNAKQMVMVGLLLGQQVLTVRGIATALRAQIYDAATDTKAKLNAIHWPT
jgi:hypothetical protein